MKPNRLVQVRQLRRNELEAAAQILGRSMRDNPMMIFAFAISDRRSRELARFFQAVLHGLYQRGMISGAYRENKLVGVCGMARPGSCQPTLFDKLRVSPSVFFGNPVGTAHRVLSWTNAWARIDPSSPHWHLGPVGVEPYLQGQGVGSALLKASCMHIDAYGATAYLETDRRANVEFYQKFGFSVVREDGVLGMQNWFMARSRMEHCQRN